MQEIQAIPQSEWLATGVWVVLILLLLALFGMVLFLSIVT